MIETLIGLAAGVGLVLFAIVMVVITGPHSRSEIEWNERDRRERRERLIDLTLDH
jgi:hypothetical protein